MKIIFNGATASNFEIHDYSDGIALTFITKVLLGWESIPTGTPVFAQIKAERDPQTGESDLSNLIRVLSEFQNDFDKNSIKG